MIKKGLATLLIMCLAIPIFAEEHYELNTNNSVLKLNSSGEIVFLGLNGEEPFIKTKRGSLWEIILQQPSDFNVIGGILRLTSESSAGEIKKISNGYVVSYTRLRGQEQDYDVSVEIEIKVDNDAFTFNYELINNEQNWLVKEVRCPVININYSNDRYNLILPTDAGRKIDNLHSIGITYKYPSEGSMQFIVFDANFCGMYLGSHDESFQTTYFKSYYLEDDKTLEASIVKFPYLKYGSKWESAPLIVKPYQGKWHIASKYYKSWAETWYLLVQKPEWVKNITGWQLVIMKQQNGEVIWGYNDIDALIKLGKESGLNVIGLYGWTSGGHDRGYPVYQADPAMGGETLLREKIKKAHQNGLKVILYVNGQLQDVLCDFYQQKGKDIACVSQRGEPFLEMWHKYDDESARVHAYGCQSTDGWSDVLLSLAKQINDLGADGILFDQIGNPRWDFCFSEKHNHESPSMAAAPGVIKNMRKVQNEMQKINPNFIVMTEHMTDCIQQFIDFTHGSGGGCAPANIYKWDFDYSSMENVIGSAFPEILRYTFPDLRFTQRHKAPIMDKFTVNYGLFYGLMPEVEYRYMPEKLFVLDGVVPSYKDLE